MNAGRFILLVVAIGVAIVGLLLMSSVDLPGFGGEEPIVAPTLDLKEILGTPSSGTDDGAETELRVAAPAGSWIPNRALEYQFVGPSSSGRKIGVSVEYVDPTRRASAVGATLLGQIPGPAGVSVGAGTDGVVTSISQELRHPTGMDLLFGSLIVLDQGSNELVWYDVAEPSAPSIKEMFPLDPNRLAESPYVLWDQVEAGPHAVYVAGRPAQIVSYELPSDRPLLIYFPHDFTALGIAASGLDVWVATPEGNLAYKFVGDWQPRRRMNDEMILPSEEGVGAGVCAAENVHAFYYSDRTMLAAYEIRSDGLIYPHDWLSLGSIVEGVVAANPPSVAYQNGMFFITHAGGLLVLNQHGRPIEPDSSSWSRYELLASWDTDRPPTHVEVAWPLVALSDADNTYVLDVSDAPLIEEVARYHHGGGTDDELAMSLIDGDRLYVLNSATGLHILELEVSP